MDEELTRLILTRPQHSTKRLGAIDTAVITPPYGVLRHRNVARKHQFLDTILGHR
jgi:hypothetical protein